MCLDFILLGVNVHPKRIRSLMGHSTIRVTMDVYGHLMHDADKEATEKLAALVLGGSYNAIDSRDYLPDDNR